MNNEQASVLIHWKGLRSEEDVHDHLANRCRLIASEFPETDSYELRIEPSRREIQCHGHVNGKQTRVAAHAQGLPTARQAADSVLDKLERELRRDHDKRIFSRRRKAQKDQIKRVV
jgi:ribosome-associated translation inhibitor RaiA